jgi:pimeloyl-ACP methyl ester carboxylesterase
MPQDVSAASAQSPPPSRRRRWSLIGLGAIGAVVAVALWVAYLFQPGEVRDRTSRFLAHTPTSYVDTKAARFHYLRRGQGPPVLLLHGGGEWLYSYRDMVTALAGERTVIAVDLPGHGYTKVKDSGFGYDLQAMTDALAQFLDAVDVHQTAIIGHSWGGGIALAFAQRFPDRVSDLVLLDSSGLNVPDTAQWRLLKVPVLGEIMSKLVRREDVRSGLEQSFANSGHVTDEMVDEVWVPLTFRVNRRSQYMLERGLDWSQTERAMPSTRTRTLVIWGREDRYLSVTHAERFRKLLPAAELVVLDGCGHSVHEECPEQVNPLVLRFLRD